MDTGSVEWWRRHGWTIGLLLVAFVFAFSVRTIWQYPVIQQFGALYTYAGGSDSYYHSRVMTYIIQTHHNLVHDPMLKFPVGAINPREPLFDWMNAVLGMLFAPAFGGNAVSAGAWFLDFDPPLWAALAVFPIYLIGREVTGRRAGLIAALVYPFFSASIDSSTFGYANYLSFYTFFLLIVIYAFLRTLKAVGHRRWVESYRDRRQYVPAVLGFLRTERTAVKWSVFTGVALGALALAWQGYTYAIVVVAFTVLVAMLIERIRHVDSFGFYVSTCIIGLVAFPMAAPYYLVQGDFRLFLELPVILFFGTLLLMLPFLLLRDVPWVFSIPALAGVVVAGILGLRFASPALFASAITGNGYFVKTLVYTTVAEAQAPSIDALIVNYGIVTFFLAFAGLALLVYQLVRGRFKRFHIAFVIFAVVSIYLPISAAKFFLVASPAFGLLAAEGIHRLLDVGGYPKLRRSVASLTDRSGSLAAFRKSFKARHVLVLALAVGILLPNIWIAIDAGIPSNTKNHVAQQINQTIPSWLKLNQSSPSSSYLGAAGSGLDTSNQYDSAAYNWLSQQDANVPEPNRPAFVSWWDYGFQAIDQGQHPSVADNFQNGIDPAGQFLLSQNESLAIGILATTLLQGELQSVHSTSLPSSLVAVLTEDGVNASQLQRLLTDEPADYTTVVRNPAIFLPVNPSTITDDNAMYLATSYYLASHLSLSGVAQVYDDLQKYTGWSIRYAMSDSRLFPFSGQDTGIFYAPADLTGRVINAEGLPTTFFSVTILGSDGNTYPYGPLPAGVTAAQYSINYTAAFFNSMIYHIYIGYNGSQVGQGTGIPGLSGVAQTDPIEPGWMLQHFEVEYRTGYVCPGVKNAQAGAPCMVAQNRPAATAIANRTNGSDDLSAVSYFQGGETILAYYPGVTLYGRVALPNGNAVPGARVTVYDGWGIPHMTNVTSANGTFTLVLPPGNDTVNISYGSFNRLGQSDSNPISSVKLPISDALGFDNGAPSMMRTFTVPNASVSGLVYWNITGNSTYSAGDAVVRGAQVVLENTAGVGTISTTTDASGTFELPQVPPGSYNVSVHVGGVSYALGKGYTNVSGGGTVPLSIGLSGGAIRGSVTTSSSALYSGATVTLVGPGGAIATATTNGSGRYDFEGLAPGTYAVSAVGLDPALRSNRVPVTLSAPGANSSADLTLVVGGSVEVGLQGLGFALPNATVTFSPLVSFASGTSSAVNDVFAATTNTTFGNGTAQGIATATLPVGAYSVYALARLGGVLYAAVGTVNVSGPGASPTLLLNLTPARAVNVTIEGPRPTASKTVVVATSADGGEVTGWAGSNGTVLLQLPDGAYSLLAIRGGLAAGSNTSVGLAGVTVAGPTQARVTAGTAVGAHFTVGTPASGGSVLTAPNATVVLSAGPSGPSIRVVSTAGGAAGLVLPAVPPGAAGGYCLGASAFGFRASYTCGLSAAELTGMTTLNLTVVPVPVTLSVVGLPPSTSVTVNVTGESAGTSTFTLTGGPGFAFNLTPGVYGIGARAVIGHGTTVYLPSSLLSTTIPLGATASRLTLVVVPEINATGKLTLPSGLSPSATTVSLVSPLLNLTVNGTAYTSSFRATPTTYTATVTGKIGAITYVNISRVTLAANGTVSPRIDLSQVGSKANLTLVGPTGGTLAVNATVTLVTPAGLAIHERAVNGGFTAVLPTGTYRVFVNATLLTSGTNGTYFTNWTSGPSASCTFSFGVSTCQLPLTGTPVLVNVQGALVPSTGGPPVAGSLRLVGPYPSTNTTVVTASTAGFAVALLPGAYYVYATSSGSPALAAFGRLLALPVAALNVTIPLLPTWTAGVQVTVQAGSVVPTGLANVTVKDLFGDLTSFPNVSVGAVLDLPLPAGTYAFSSRAPGTMNGVTGTAVASTKVALSDGNVAVTLPLAVPVVAAVSASLSGSSTVTVPAGGQVSFSFSVRASGNVPVTVHPVGSPGAWQFSFSFTNLTLSPGASANGEVLVTVPAGTSVTHGPVTLAFDFANGTEAGAVRPSPTVNVVPYYGVSAGTSAASVPQVGSRQALLPFYVVDTGNSPETVQLTVVDAGRLASYGWSTGWLVSSVKLPSGLLSLSPAQNRSVTLNLTTSSMNAPEPGPVTVQVTVVNVTGTITSIVVLTFPHPAVATSSGSFAVTGPQVQGGPSGLPTWVVPVLVFVPALGLFAAVTIYRWWRTRRWTRR